MNKWQTVGMIGEKLVKETLLRGGVDFVNMSETQQIMKKTMCFTDDDGKKIFYTTHHKGGSNFHPYDLSIRDKGVEIKTSRIRNGKFNCSLAKNDKDSIDILVIVILSDNKELLHYHLLDKEFFYKYQGLNFSVDKFPKLDGKDLILLLKSI